MKTPILQFGTSRFLQAHADLFISEAMAGSQAVGPITVVQSSGDAARSHRLEALAASQGYPVRIQGLQDGETVRAVTQVTSIRRALSTATDWERLVDIFVNEAEFVLSNTGDKGFATRGDDLSETFCQSMSYPAKLTLLLHARYQQNARSIQIMPMELVANNGDVLRARVLELAHKRGPGFLQYLEKKVLWVNSLVDRIVSEPIEPAGAVAEPYALWAIEDQGGLIVPCRHAAVQVVDSLDRIEALKLFILNLGHSFLAEQWLRAGSDPKANVLDCMNNAVQRNALMQLYHDEVVPGFQAAGLGDDAQAYIHTTLERFSNPFLDHRLADIAQNHGQKTERRIAAFIAWARERGDAASKPILQAIVDRSAAAN